MRRVAALVAVLALIGVATWLVWPSAPDVRGQDLRIPVVDGPADDQRVELDATYFAPPGGGKAPAVLLAHGFGGSKQSVRQQAMRVAQDGYAVLTWSARGFGRSTGEIALNSPDYEVKDVKQLIDWLAKRPEVQLDADGDPRVGISGGSYGGAIALMTAAHDARVDAIVPQITWSDLSDALFPDSSGNGPENGVFKRMWAGIFFGEGVSLQGGLPLTAGRNGPARPLTEQEAKCGRFLPEICEMYQEVAQSGRATPEAVALLRRSSPITVANRIKAPTLLIQGQRDSLFPLSHADANARAIAATGTPVSLLWFDGGHDGGNGEADWLYEQSSAWFARHLKGDKGAAPVSAFTVTRDGGRDPGTRQRIRLHPEAGAYPGLSGSKSATVDLTGPAQYVVNPPGGAPAAISTVPGVSGLLGGGQSGGISLDMPGQAAMFESAPLTAPLRLTGSPTAKITVTGSGEATLFVKLYDVAEATQLPVLPGGQVAPLRVTIPEGARSTEVTVRLPAVDHGFAAGHRLRLVVTTTDMGFATPAEPATFQVSLAAPGLTLPEVDALAAPPTGVAWWVWGMPLAAVLVAAGILATGRTRSRQAAVPAESDGAPAPLEISGLTKAYKNGYKAVDDLSFRVEQGQVLGLLGPNGAGKTTTMRMMMGLIHPDDGEIRIFGETVTPGAPVLSRLGSFVEGPGFLPHLSGRENLELYWAATGRPVAEARFDEALEIAGLGDALKRAVRTYSQGMRQRLAIAQAMLGLPDLLVLDEPTNGLDPPQIREMREVLKRYAGEGRTVIVSSHLLAEVEQTCSHVVVMHQGRLVSAGPVSVLLKSSVSGNGHGPRLEDVFLDLIGRKS
ncbi:CocE/NonD family hydrolase [Nonomuraea sp. NN258]|uniref:CocE/NonD family hydrolase n=1 Tax=Nonomuraea antri TaxID=2730852 RepID=UPI001567DFFF|nr:CocE/NonD family hydrolase [Nonomuraea antri]NRQ36766.1 CocE/NonD family hydrolase [Nonomuraea antri]